MFDIDKYLNEMEIKDMNIDEEVVRITKGRCKEEQWMAHEQQGPSKLKKAVLIAIPTAAVLLIGILVVSLLLSPMLFPNTVAYYTIDVNPSICVHVDAEGSVTSVVSQNADAQEIVDKLDVKGDNVTDAIGKILSAIKDAGYLDAGQRYVLIGCFAADGTMVQSSLGDLQARLEADFGDMIDLLLVSGDLDDMQQANQLKVSAGLLKLSQLANGVDVTDKNVEQVINCIDNDNYFAPELSASVTDKINLSWDAIDFDAMGYAGKVRYSIAAGDTEDEVKSGDAPIIKTVSFYTYGEQTLSASVALDPGVTKYFALYAKYGDTVKCSNAVMATMPGEIAPSPTPTQTPAPEPSDGQLAPHTMTGRISGEKVVLSWSKETAENLSGYKVVASKTNPNPSYPDDGYLKYITNRETTSFSVYAGYGGLEANTYYYFSITYLYNDGSTIAANAVRLKVPPKSEAPPSDDYASSKISGSIDDNTVHLSWTKITDERFAGYKVMYSFSDSTPVYKETGCHYYDYITEYDDNSRDICVHDLNGFSPGETCWFSITVLYNKEGVKKAGNVISFTMPGTPPEPYPATDINVWLSDDKTRVNFSWDAISDGRLDCYKVVGSRTDNTPSYGEQDYMKATENTYWSISVEDLIEHWGGIRGERFYFAITAYYCGDHRETGSPGSIKLPELLPDPSEPPDPSDSPSEPPPSEPPTE